MLAVDEGLISQTILELYSKLGIVAEPAGATSVAALELIKDNKSKLKNDQLNKELINMLSKLGFIILSNDKTANIDNIIENVKLVLKS